MDVSITIIIPVYNVEEYLKQCLESVVNQSVPFDEVILVNDGSTDSSLSICRHYASAYNYIKLLSQDNRGLSAARNIGMGHASGSYIMFLDSDDYLRTDTAHIIKEHLKESHYDAVFFDADIFFEDDCNYFISRNGYDRKDAGIDNMDMNGLEYFRMCYPGDYVASACMAVYNKQLIEKEKIEFPEGMFYEDTYFSFVFAIKAKCVKHISEKLYQRRYRNHSITMSNYSEKNFRDHIDIGLLIWNVIKQNQELWIPAWRELFLSFVNDYFGLVWNKFQLLKKQNEFRDAQCARQTFMGCGVSASGSMQACLEAMIGQYLLMTDALYLPDAVEDISLLNKLLHNLHYIYSENLRINRENIRRIILNVVKGLKRFYSTLLSRLPLHQKAWTIGIYGTGNHTEGLLAIFEKAVGSVDCKLVFIDSYREDGVYRGRKVINYKKIDESLDLIIVSSFLYEKEMIQHIRDINSGIPICRFYEKAKEDMFSEYKIFLEYF